MAGITWHTYTEPQARQRRQVLEHLMGERLLTGDEEKVAKRLLTQFKDQPAYGENSIQVYANPEAEEFLQRLEESLWESRK